MYEKSKRNPPAFNAISRGSLTHVRFFRPWCASKSLKHVGLFPGTTAAFCTRLVLLYSRFGSRGRPRERCPFNPNSVQRPLGWKLGLSACCLAMAVVVKTPQAEAKSLSPLRAIAIHKRPHTAPPRAVETPPAAAEVGQETAKRNAMSSTPQAPLASRKQATAAAVADYIDPVSPLGQSARGLYISGPFLRRHGVRHLIQHIKAAHLNAAVIDMKDDRGRITYATSLPSVQAQVVVMIEDPRALVRALKSAGIYTIGRVVCFNDDKLAGRDPSRAILDTRKHRRGKPWQSWGTRTHWLDPYNSQNQALIVALAKEVESLGFDEVQLDYIRFPVDKGTRFASYPSKHTYPKNTSRRRLLSDLLRRVDAAVHIPLGVDVFGLTAFRTGDPSGLGQSLEDWAPYVEVFTPMLYLNNMKSWGHRGTGGSRETRGRAMRLIHAGVSRMRKRLGPEPVIRPFLQAFRPGADYFNRHFISEQVHGARDGGADGFLFWHPASNYGIVGRARSHLRPSRHSKSGHKRRLAFRTRKWRDARRF